MKKIMRVVVFLALVCPVIMMKGMISDYSPSSFVMKDSGDVEQPDWDVKGKGVLTSVRVGMSASTNPAYLGAFLLGDEVNTGLITSIPQAGDNGKKIFPVTNYWVMQATGWPGEVGVALLPRRCVTTLATDILYKVAGSTLSVTVPFVQAEHKLNPVFTNLNTQAQAGNAADKLQAYFAGDGVPGTNQGTLQFGRIFNNWQRSVGLGDLCLAWEWGTQEFLEDALCKISFACALPTSDRPTGSVIFEPVRGNEGATDLSGRVKILFPKKKKNEHVTVQHEFGVGCGILLPFDKVLVAGLKSKPWGHAALVGIAGMQDTEPVVPVGNVFSGLQRMNSRLHGVLMYQGELEYRDLDFGFSYKLQYQEGERTVTLAPDKRAGLARSTFYTAGGHPFGDDPDDFEQRVQSAWLRTGDFHFDRLKPALVSQKIGFFMQKMRDGVFCRGGAEIAFFNKNQAFNEISAYFSLGIAF